MSLVTETAEMFVSAPSACLFVARTWVVPRSFNAFVPLLFYGMMAFFDPNASQMLKHQADTASRLKPASHTSPTLERGGYEIKMPFWRTYYHLIWATKRRKPLITPELEKHLYGHLVQKASELGIYVYAINGETEHTHVVATIPPKLAVSDAVQKLKGSSSHFVTSHELTEEHFSWQRGYGALTLGYTQLDRAIAYVDNQKQHHAKQKNLNKWLEHIADIDDGPAATASKYLPDSMILREDSAEYTTNDDWIFP